MAEELNSSASSQPAPTAGTNGTEKPAEAGGQGGMTPSQQSDYYAKTQQLAADRRTFEAERQAFYSQRPQNPASHGHNGYSQGQVPGMFPQGQGSGPVGQGYQQPSYGFGPPPSYGQLVEQFGADGASTIMSVVNQLAGPVQQKIAIAEAQLSHTQMLALETQLNARGKETYGQEWSESGQEAMDLIKQFGMPLEKAWFAVTGEKSFQRGRDEAYRNQATKEGQQVAQPSAAAQPPSGGAPIGSFGDAFKSAWSEHNA